MKNLYAGIWMIPGVLALVCATPDANASTSNESASFSVTGTILPAACSISLQGGGKVDYGTMRTSDDTFTGTPINNNGGSAAFSLGSKVIGYTITCQAPTRVEMSFQDNSGVQKLLLGDTADDARYGLVDANNSGMVIGCYDIDLLSGGLPTITNGDGSSAQISSFVFAPTGRSTWNSSSVDNLTTLAAPGYAAGPWFGGKESLVSNDYTPDAFLVLAGSLNFTAYVSASYVQSAVAQIKLAGSGTITLEYL